MSTWGLSDCIEGIEVFLSLSGSPLFFYRLIWALHHFQLLSLQEFTVREDALTKLLRDFWKPDGQNTNTQNEEKLKVAMRNAGVDPDNVFIATFLKAGEFAAQRKKVARELGLLSS